MNSKKIRLAPKARENPNQVSKLKPVPERRGGLQAALPGLEKHREKMDDADQGMEASAATIRDRVRRQNAVTLNHQQAIYTEKLRPSSFAAQSVAEVLPHERL